MLCSPKPAQTVNNTAATSLFISIQWAGLSTCHRSRPLLCRPMVAICLYHVGLGFLGFFLAPPVSGGSSSSKINSSGMSSRLLPGMVT